MPLPHPDTIPSLLEGIARDGYAVVENFFPPEKIALLAQEAKQLQLEGVMRRASTGKNNGAQADAAIRGDFIHWLQTDNPASLDMAPAQQEYLHQMESLRTSLNANFYLGLFELESHFAIYPPGAIYRKHLDQFQGFEERQVSCILYLNKDWRHEDGGQLRLYLDGMAEQPYLDVEPNGGTFVAFLSGRFWHEVLPAKRERTSLTGWFRTRAAGLAA